MPIEIHTAFKFKLVTELTFCEPFWIARIGDWSYLFDHPTGRLIGKLFVGDLAARDGGAA